MINEELAGPRNNLAHGYGKGLLEDYSMKRGMVFGSIIVAAMLAFELFNYTMNESDPMAVLCHPHSREKIPSCNSQLPGYNRGKGGLP